MKTLIENNAFIQRIRFSNDHLTAAGFSLLFFFSCSLPAISNDCTSNRIDQTSVVTRVYDGDTIKLSNGRKIRLIGINTPEMNYKTGNPEPFAKKAKQFLKQKILKQKVGLRYGAEKKDHYGRTLAHVFLNNTVNLQQALLSQGLAFNISIPPNLWQHNCYLKAEQEARRNKIGLWKNHHKNIIGAKNITRNHAGFQFVKGRVLSIRKNKNAIWLKLSSKISLRIKKKYLSYFKNFNIQHLKGQKVVARGWMHWGKKRATMNISHPSALQKQ